MSWQQNYDPLHGPLSPIVAALPLVILLGLLALRRVPAYAAALAGLGAALAVAIGVVGMPAPVAVTGARLIGLGFPPLEASALSLIANTAPVAFGALGTPIIALQGVTGLDLGSLSAMVGRQLPIFSLIVPFWLIAAYSGVRGMLEVWPALLVAGV